MDGDKVDRMMPFVNLVIFMEVTKALLNSKQLKNGSHVRNLGKCRKQSDSFNPDLQVELKSERLYENTEPDSNYYDSMMGTITAQAFDIMHTSNYKRIFLRYPN